MKFTHGEVAIVTGASRGIGRAVAVELAKEGCRIVIDYRVNREEAVKTLSLVGEKNGLLVQADVTVETDVKHLVAAAVATYGRIDILVNNAGEIFRPGDWTGDLETWRKTIDVNLTGAWLMVREVAPVMKKQKKGNIVNIVSVYGMTGAAGVLAYTSAKGGLITMTKSFAKEFAPEIRVNAVAPSNVMTDMTKGVDAKLLQWFRDQTPLGRIADPDELAKPVVFLASDDASYITGHVLVVDGGYGMK